MEINSGRQICDVSPWIWFQSIHAETSYLKPEIGYGGEEKKKGARGERERYTKKQRWREKRGGWNQPIWKRGDRKSLWQPGIMRFGSLCGFLFTWKGINIKKHTLFSIPLTSFQPIIAPYPFLPLSVISASGGSIIWLFIANGVFLPGLEAASQKKKSAMCDQTICSIAKKPASYTPQRDVIGCFRHRCYFGLISLCKALRVGMPLRAMGGNECKVSFSAG